MDHIRRTSLFMQIVNILGDDHNIKILFQLSENLVPAVGFNFTSFFPALIVEFENQRLILSPALRLGHLHYIVTFPQPSRIAKSRDTSFRTNASACENNKFFLCHDGSMSD